jgi:ascorbate-specific PTS system EIIC-type component UlaA
MLLTSIIILIGCWYVFRDTFESVSGCLTTIIAVIILISLIIKLLGT